MRQIGFAILLALAAGTISAAQSPVPAPNRMAPHTAFIILIVGAFLGWAASFSFHTMKERSRKDDRAALAALRETLLDQLAEAEQALESGTIEKDAFERRRKELRGELAGVIEKLQKISPPKRKGT